MSQLVIKSGSTPALTGSQSATPAVKTAQKSNVGQAGRFSKCVKAHYGKIALVAATALLATAGVVAYKMQMLDGFLPQGQETNGATPPPPASQTTPSEGNLAWGMRKLSEGWDFTSTKASEAYQSGKDLGHGVVNLWPRESTNVDADGNVQSYSHEVGRFAPVAAVAYKVLPYAASAGMAALDWTFDQTLGRL